MADYIRRLVSGNKARFKDGQLNLELDLVYITDHVVIMGYPAAGIEGFYRNRREDAKRFLEHRHGKNFWVFNFCPVKENSYPASVFDGRVSRYPFPDHHAPPLAILALAAREIRGWLNGSSERVAVLHCKAGKGRSGTLACSYLLSLEYPPSPPRLERSYTAKEWAKIRADQWMQIIPQDDTPDEHINALQNRRETDTGRGLTPKDKLSAKTDISPTPSDSPSQNGVLPDKLIPDSLKNILDLHTSRRMKASSPSPKEVKQGVSIPSQRRWLLYWSLLLAHEAPRELWPIPPLPEARRPKICLTHIKLRIRETSRLKIGLVKATNIVIEKTNLGKPGPSGKGSGHVWASLARYDDEFVQLLEKWERHTRNEDGSMGKRRADSDHMDGNALSALFAGGKWDRGKMVRSFARLGPSGDEYVQKENTEKDGKILTYTLRPLSDAKWETILDQVQQEGVQKNESVPGVISESNSMYDITQAVRGEGVVLDACREVRVKLYIGQVFMGWMWFIPVFHTPSPQSSSNGPFKFLLTHKEVDFPLGVGSGILDVEIALSWCPESEIVQPPARKTSEESAEEGSAEPGGLASTLHVAVGGGGIDEVVHAKQAVED